MSGENRAKVYYDNKLLYHLVLLVSFAGAVLLKEIIEFEIRNRLTQNNILALGASFLIMYILAIYVFPEIGFLLAKQMNKN